MLNIPPEVVTANKIKKLEQEMADLCKVSAYIQGELMELKKRLDDFLSKPQTKAVSKGKK